MTLTINGKPHEAELPAEMPLLWALRDEFRLPGTKYGCGVAQCGACTVHINGVPTRACITPVGAAQGTRVATIEGLADLPHGAALQAAWLKLDVMQCGYCQAGQLMSAAALLKANPRPTDADIDAAMSGNVCRCATYTRIRAAIKLAAGLDTTDRRPA